MSAAVLLVLIATPWVSLSSPNPMKIGDPSGGKRTVPIAFAFDGVDPAEASIELTQSLTGLWGADPATGVSFETSTLTIDMAQLGHHRRLDLRFRATSKGRRPVDLDLKVEVAAPEIETPKGIHIERMWWGETRSSRLMLREKLGASRATDLRLEALDVRGPNNEPISVRIRGAKDVLGARRLESMTYVIEGDLPMGTSKGSIALEARELAVPAVFDVTLVHRVHRLTIILLVLIGLLAGFVLRSVIEVRLAREKILDRGGEVLRAIDSDLARVPDADTNARLTQVRSGLTEALSKYSDRTPEAITSAAASHGAVLLELEQRWRASAARLEPYARALHTRWDVPEDIGSRVTDARRQVERAEDLLESRDVAGAKKAIDGLEPELGKLKASLVGWVASVRAILERIRDEKETPDRLRATVAQGTPVVMAGVERVASAATDPGALGASLLAVTEARALLRSLVSTLAIAGDDLVRWLRNSVADGEIQSIQSSWTLGRARATAAIEPDAGLQCFLEALADVHSLLRDRWKDELTDELRDELDARNYTKVVEALERDGSTGEEVLGDDVDEPASTEPSAIPMTPMLLSLPAAGARALVQAALEPPSTSPHPPAVRFVERVLTKLVRFLIVSLFIGIGGYVLFESSYVGTPEDLAKILLWGFGFDVAADRVLDTVIARAKVQSLSA